MAELNLLSTPNFRANAPTLSEWKSLFTDRNVTESEEFQTFLRSNVQKSSEYLLMYDLCVLAYNHLFKEMYQFVASTKDYFERTINLRTYQHQHPQTHFDHQINTDHNFLNLCQMTAEKMNTHHSHKYLISRFGHHPFPQLNFNPLIATLFRPAVASHQVVQTPSTQQTPHTAVIIDPVVQSTETK